MSDHKDKCYYEKNRYRNKQLFFLVLINHNAVRINCNYRQNYVNRMRLTGAFAPTFRRAFKDHLADDIFLHLVCT
jgi:hypothetical protein